MIPPLSIQCSCSFLCVQFLSRPVGSRSSSVSLLRLISIVTHTRCIFPSIPPLPPTASRPRHPVQQQSPPRLVYPKLPGAHPQVPRAGSASVSQAYKRDPDSLSPGPPHPPSLHATTHATQQQQLHDLSVPGQLPTCHGLFFPFHLVSEQASAGQCCRRRSSSRSSGSRRRGRGRGAARREILFVRRPARTPPEATEVQVGKQSPIQECGAASCTGT